MSLLNPSSRAERGIIIISGAAALIAAVWYVITKIDIIPDTLGAFGYLDDAIVLILGLVFLIKFIDRVKGRYTRNKSEFSRLWNQGSLFKLLLKAGTWVRILLVTGAIWYFFWTLDLIPDSTVAVGYLDDIIVALAALIPLLRYYNKR